MNVKTMEGLAGAATSISLVSTPMSAAKEAERKGDTDKMIRALGYAADLTNQAQDYSEKTSQGMKLDGEEAKKQEKLRQEQLIQARKEEREEQAKRAEEKVAEKTGDSEFDSVEISEEGRYQAESVGQTPSGGTDSADSIQDVTYGNGGEIAEAVPEAGGNVDVRV